MEAGRPPNGTGPGRPVRWAACAATSPRRCLVLHATLLVLLPAFAWLTSWQLGRAEGGNTLSWAYVFLWPCFAVYAVYTWWNLVRDDVARQAAPAGRGHPGPGPGRRRCRPS